MDNINSPFNFYPNVVTFNQNYYMFVQETTKVCEYWILIDSQSTVDLFYNPDLLTNIRKVKEELVVNCNAGKVRANLVGDLNGYGPVWFYADGIASIL